MPACATHVSLLNGSILTIPVYDINLVIRMAAASPLSPEQLQAVLNGPALHPPPGVTPELDHPPSSSTETAAVLIVCLSIASVAVLMRVFTKTRIIRQVTFADCE